MVIARHSDLSTPLLCEAVQRHAPEATREDMIAELRRQAAAQTAAADYLRAQRGKAS